MSDRYPGGIITKTPVTPAGPYAEGSAPGVWTLEQQAYWQAQGLWPSASNPTPNDPYFQYVTSLLHGDGTNGGQNNTFLDSSTNAFTITRNGNTTQGSFSPYGSNWGTYFAGGSGYYITSPANSAFEFTADFTFECWYNFAGFSSVHSLFTIANGSTYCLNVDITNQQYSFIINGTDYRFNTKFTDGVWEHVAVVRSGSTITVYKNGIAIGTATNSSTWGNTTQAFWISDNAYKGYISNLRLVASAVYTSNFTPSTTPLTAIANTRLLCMQSNRYIDNSGNNLTLTPGNSSGVSVTRFSPFAPTYATQYSASTIGGSGYFDGSSTLTVASNSALQFNGAFTIEAWVYLTTSSTERQIYSSYTGGGDNVQFYVSIGNNLVCTLNGGSFTITGSTTINANTWYHFAVARSGSTVTLYVNGVSDGSGTYSSTAPTTQSGATIGNYAGGGSYYLTGYISNLRVVKGTAVYTSTFTPPTTPLTAISGTSLLCYMTNGAIYDNAMIPDYETVGNAQISTSVKKYGTGSLAFDGTGDALRGVPNNVNLRFGTGNFTVEGWFYQTADKTYPSALEIGDHITNGILFITKTSGNACVYAGGFYGGAATTLNQWNHIAWVRVSGVLKIFVNGVLGSTTAFTNDLSDVSVTTVGAEQTINANYAFPGYIDDLRITKGYARYWENFTPPAAALPNFGGAYQVPTQDPQFNYTTLLLPGNGTNGAQNNTFLDSSTNAFTITRNGNTTQGTFTPFSQTGWGNYFDGNLDYIYCSPSNLTGQYTIEGWFCADDYDNAINRVFFGNWSTGFLLRYNSNTLEFYSKPGGSLVSGTATITLQPNVWYYIQVTRDSSNVQRVFLNGNLLITISATSGTITMTNFCIGAENTSVAGTADQWKGYVSNFRILNGTCANTTNFTPPTSPLTAITNTSLLTCQSNRFVDNSGNSVSLSVTGTPSVQAFSPFAPTAAYSASTVGGSGYFDGTGDYLTAPDNTALDLGNSDFTIEFWQYPLNTDEQRTITKRSSAVSEGYIVAAGGSRNVEFYGAVSGSYSVYFSGSTSAAMPANAWSHVAISRSGSNWAIFVNGTRYATYSSSATLDNGSSSLYIGKDGGDAQPVTGYLSNVRIVKGTAVYDPTQTTYTVPTAPLTAVTNTSLLLSCTNAGITDATANNDLETVGNAQISTTQSKFGGSSMYFDGTGVDWLQSANSPNNQLGGGDFTVECWVYLLQDNNTICAKNYGSANGLLIWTQSGQARIRTYNNSGTATTIQTGTVLSQSTWTHLAFVRYGSTITIYVNGTSQVTGTSSDILNSTGIFTIGAYNSGTLPMNGYLQDLRITKGYARYVQNFTPPAQADQLY